MAVRGTVGIDPGLDGAICLVVNGSIVEMHEMPTAMTANGKRVVDQVGLWGVISALQSHFFAVEHVSAIQGASSGSSFNFGTGWGMLLMALAACECQYTLVKPTAWKRSLGIAASKNKQARKSLAIQRANQLFPGAGKTHWPKLSDDGKAESALIAYWGASQ